MASRYSIETIFKAIDQFTNPVKRMQTISMAFSNRFNKDFAIAQRRVDQFSSNFRNHFGNAMMIGTGLAIAGISKFIYDSTGKWDMQISALKSVEATLNSTNGTVLRSLSDLEKQASSLQKKTFFGDEAILQKVTAQMLTFTNITGTQFDKAQIAVLDVTAKLRSLGATGEDLQGITLQLSKALNDPVSNLGALSRSGIQFSKQQKDQIKLLAQSGKLWMAQDIILAEIQKQYGGTAEALTKTAQGLNLQNKNLIGDIQEVIGKAIEPLRLKILNFVNNGLKKIDTTKLASDIERGANALWNFGKFVVNLIKVLKPFIIIWGIALALWKIYWIGMAAATFIVPMMKFIRLIMIITKWKGAWVAIQYVLNAALTANPIGLIIMGIAALIAIIILLIIYYKQIIKFTKEWSDTILGVITFMNIMLYPITLTISFIKQLVTNWEAVKEAFKSEGLIGGLLAIGKVLVSSVLAPIQGLLRLLGKIPVIGEMFKKWELNIGNFREGLFDKQAPITQGERYSYSKQETTNKGELTIKDNTGRAEMKNNPVSNLYNIKLLHSGAFAK